MHVSEKHFILTVIFHALPLLLDCKEVRTKAPQNITVIIYVINVIPFLQSLPFVGPGFDVGIRDVNKQFKTHFHILHQYLTSPNITDCSDLTANYNMLAQYYYTERKSTETLVIFLAGCDDSVVVPVFGKEWNVLTLLTGTTFSNVRNRDHFPTTIALGSFQYISYAYMASQILTSYHWTSSAIVYGLPAPGSAFYALIANDYMLPHIGQSQTGMQMYPFPISLISPVGYKKLIQEIIVLSRIVFLALPPALIRQFMIAANSMGLTKTKEFDELRIQIVLSPKVWVSVELPQAPDGSFQWTPEDDDSSLEWFSSFFTLTTCYKHEPGLSTLYKEMSNRAISNYNTTFPPNSEPSEFTLTSYSATQILAQVLNETLAKTGNLSDGKHLAQQILNRTFHLNTIGDMNIDAFGERQNRMCLLGFQLSTKTFEMVKYYDGPDSKGMQNTSFPIVWQTMDGNPPPNEPFCGFRGDRLQCRSSKDILLIAVVVSASFLVMALIAAFTEYNYREKLHHGSYKISWWSLDNGDLHACIDETKHSINHRS